MRILHFFYLFTITCLLPLMLHAQDRESWTMTHFNSENGLPQNSVMGAEIDKDGYLWLATQGGIACYDGQRFRIYDNNNSALLWNRYLSFGKNDKGNVYCIDEDGKAALYDNETGFSKPCVIPGLVRTTSGGIIDISHIDIEPLARYTAKFSHKPLKDYLDFLYHPVGKGRGFMAWQYNIGYVSNSRLKWTCLPEISRSQILTVGAVGDKLCFVTRNREVVLVDSNGVHTRKKIPVAFPQNKSLVNLSSVAFFKQENQMLLHLDGDIFEVALAGNELEFRHLIKVKNITFITCMRYYPETGLLIVGSNTQGLFMFRKQNLAAVGENKENGGAFYCLAPHGDDGIFSPIGTLPGSPSVPGTSDAYNRQAVLRDHNRHYWYAQMLTLQETDEKMRVLRKVPLTKWLACVQEDETGTIWVNQGPSNFGRVQGEKFVPYNFKSLSGKYIESFIPLGNQTFWIVGKGLCMWLDVKRRRQRIYHEFDKIELRTVYRDKQGNLWMGSYGQGYYLFRNGKFTKMPEDGAHHLKIVHSFLEDRNGFIWMTTNNGLFQCAVKDLYDYASGKSREVYQHYYGKESGLKTTEFNGGCTPSGLRLGNGTFAFPSMNGVVIFHPDSIKPVLPANKIFIEQVLLDGKPAGSPALLQIAPSFKRLEFTVSSPYFGHPNNLDIRYNVEGLDDRWYPLGENNRIVLNTLNYGRYKLRLRKEAGFGTGNFVSAELPLVVMPFFYQTWWFYLLIMACVVGIVVVVIKMRYRYLVRQRNRLEAEVKDRTRALAYQNKLMEKLTVMIAHDLKSPLYFLSKVTGHLRHNVQQENLQGIDRASSEIKNTADHVYRFVEEFNLWASSFTEGFAINKTSFTLDGLLQELGLFFKEMAESNGNRMVFSASGQFILNTDRELLKVILRNVIDNANKHTRSGEIAILLNTEVDGQVAITIADTGEGMTEPVLKRIHDRITQASTAAGIERNSRLGYQMIIDFAARLDARLEVWSERGKGTSVTLRIQGKVSGANLSQDLAEQVVSAG